MSVAQKIADAVHFRGRLADRQAADGQARQIVLHDAFQTAQPLVVEDAALHDAEQKLPGEIPALAFIEGLVGFHTGTKPPERPVDSRFNVFPFSQGRRALVESHGDVGPQDLLHEHRFLRAQKHLLAVDVALEGHALVADVPEVGQAVDLETAAVGKYGTIPGHELVQAAQLRHSLHPGACHQMIRVPQYDVGAQSLKLAIRHSLDRGPRPHRHEARRSESSVRGPDDAGPRQRAFVLMFQIKDHILFTLYSTLIP